ncbi:hypothetical protein KY290_021721 [Solanum tuberosum]|uniref:Retrotransposon gag domain-containing protein n=1 Tax=Solanum tuberosum TaxID=4113 RepID=A0ABQ7V4E2_SOLTU|nr:hypothetical protein KY289_020884 [Solanum tuberosum]KAH0758228.1 hypothetical protein KY290_021721 [Solanum tuberosum]
MAEGREIKEMLERMTMELVNFSVRQNQIKDEHEKSFAELKEALEAVKRGDKGKAVEESKGNGEMYTPSVQPMAWVSATHRRNTYYGYTWWISVWDRVHTQFQTPLGGPMHQNPAMGVGSACHMGPRTSVPYQMPSGAPNQMHYGGFHGQTSIRGLGGGANQLNFQGHFHHPMSRLSKIEFPRFNGTNLRSWIYKVDQFFSLDEIPLNQKVRVASLHFDGLAIEWHLAFIKSRQHLPYPTWDKYLYALMDRFGDEFEDPMSELKLVKQTGYVKDYQNEFDKIMTRLTILPEYAINSFITGLRHEICLTVKNHMPFSLPQAYQLARNTESQVQAQLKLTRFPTSTSGSQYKNNSYSSFSRGVGSRNDYNQDKKETPLSLNKNNNKILSSAEINERRQKGLCFFCDEKFFPGHKCGGSKSLYLLEVEDEREDQE